ncbi:unnamed protein product [Nezara viridula]|uniref:Uncharacterized protein n=1 Tax=Nezara viridula TaxID=85310 RepID=A0A9P0HLV6_NEZVI|nr:unnamed protein product [Nezara viridula]
MKTKLQGIEELKDIKDILNKQSEMFFENIERLLKIETLLEEQKNQRSCETVTGTILSVGAGLGFKLSPGDLDHGVRLEPKQEGIQALLSLGLSSKQ